MLHELLASFAKRREEFVKRREEQEIDAVVDPPLPEPQPAAAHIGVARLTPKAVVRKRSALPKAPLPKPDSPAIASESPPLPCSLREVGCGLPKKQLPAGDRLESVAKSSCAALQVGDHAGAVSLV
jgi:hypothetical protein